MKRLVVAQADGKAATGVTAPLAVGVMPPREYLPACSVVLKATLSFGSDDPLTEATIIEPRLLSLDTLSDLDGAAEDEISYPSDFVHYKPSCDVLVTGHAYAVEPVERVEARVKLAEIDRRLAVVADYRAMEIPLCRRNLRGPDGLLTEPLGPTGPAPAIPADSSLEEFDPVALQSAAPLQRLAHLPSDDTLELEGLSLRGRREIRLPRLAPRAWVEVTSRRIQPVDLRCDTLWIDTDYEQLVLTWRGAWPVTFKDWPRLHRLVVTLAADADAPSYAEALSGLPRGQVSYAVMEEDLQPGAEVVPAGVELEMAHYETMLSAADPVMSLEDYAQISAEIAEQQPPRAKVLERHELDDDSWTVEERAWLERMGDEVSRGDSQLAVRFGELFVAAQDGLAGPDEPRPLSEYAATKAILEQGEAPPEVLKKREMRLAEWMRLDRHWAKQAAEDRSVAEELDRLLEAERARAADGEESSS